MDQYLILFSLGLLWVLITNVPVHSEESTIVSTIPGFDIDFENGTIGSWTEASLRSVKWKIENQNSPWELDNPAPPLIGNGSSYLRVDRGGSLSFSVAILRSQVFIAPPGVRDVTISFSFWIRSKWPQFTNLEVYSAVNGKEELLDSFYEYADINNREWKTKNLDLVSITFGSDFEMQVVFYAYCGTNVEDAVAIDDISLTITSDSTMTTGDTTPFTITVPTTANSTTTDSTTTSTTDEWMTTSNTTDEFPTDTTYDMTTGTTFGTTDDSSTNQPRTAVINSVNVPITNGYTTTSDKYSITSPVFQRARVWQRFPRQYPPPV